MAAVDDGQAAGIVNGKADAADDNNTGSVAVPVSPVTISKVETFVSGTAQQLSANTDKTLYIDITTSAAIAVAIGPTTSTAVALFASASAALGLMTIKVPKGWYAKITGTVADFVTTSVNS